MSFQDCRCKPRKEWQGYSTPCGASNEVAFFGQHIDVVVAETFEQARHASQLMKVSYEKSEGKVDFEKLHTKGVRPKDKEDEKRGDTKAAFGNAEIKIEETCATPIYHHHPLEPHATIAEWQSENLILYNSSQIVNGAQSAAASTLNLKPGNVRIVSPYIGGGFGSKGGQWGNLVLAAVAAKMVNRPVKLALTRQQMVNSVGL